MPSKPKRSTRTKRVSTTSKTTASKPTPTVEPEPTVQFDPPAVDLADYEPAEVAPEPTPTGPTAGSLARRKRALIDELKSADTSRERQLEVHAIVEGELADVPILSYAEISRLGD